MLSKLKKISKDLILYSVLASEFEKLDFKNDALAGVRANYFNSKCSPQTEKTDVNIDNRVYSLSYSMKKGEPLSWKITYESNPVQTVRRSSDGGYCVLSYGENGIIFKRQYFDGSHTWLRTEYYNRSLENQIAAVIYPSKSNGLVILRLQRFLQTGIETIDLYPSLKAPKKRCTALIYSNSGMVWYDSVFKPADMTAVMPESDEKGFRFTQEAFASDTVSDALDLKNAPYLSDGDIERGMEETVVTAEEPEAYSAYDKIENILFEAHKTNKNIFGELASQSQKQEAPESPDDEEAAEVPEEEKTPEQPAEAAEPEASEVVAEPETDAPAEENKAEETVAKEPENEPEKSEESTEEKPVEGRADSVILTPNGSYAYYGELDENKMRSGRGRTVSPDGITAYEGEYQADKRHGFGVCYYKEGSPNYFGDWNKGNRDGRGVGFRLSDGTMHVGKWNKNKPDGFGARFDRSGEFLDVCTYIDGVRNGKSVSFDEDGNIVVKIWKDGELMGEKVISD